MKKILFAAVLAGTFTFGQETEYKFSKVIDLEPSAVCSQGKTGTCWSFSTTSFLESEVKRLTGKDIDLSEMYSVRMTYPEKAYNYVYRQGKAQFGEGGLSHDVMNSVAKYGIEPNEVYLGMTPEKQMFDHSEMVTKLTADLDSIVKNPKKYLKDGWMNTINSILNNYMGAAPEKFTYEGKEYTPQSFAKELKINPEDYVTLTSFTHHPNYSTFILEIPDNFSNGTYYNLSLNEYTEALNAALANGFTVALDTDVSEKTFSSQYGMAIWPSEGNANDYFKVMLPEKSIDPAARQKAFENYDTTDDHLMHITGIVKDQTGNQYYDVKNSWGTKGLANGGHIYMSIPYFQMKSIAFTVHKNALSKELKKKLGIK
jgi:bleomycin hydrolase